MRFDVAGGVYRRRSAGFPEIERECEERLGRVYEGTDRARATGGGDRCWRSRESKWKSMNWRLEEQKSQLHRHGPISAALACRPHRLFSRVFLFFSSFLLQQNPRPPTQITAGVLHFSLLWRFRCVCRDQKIASKTIITRALTSSP